MPLNLGNITNNLVDANESFDDAYIEWLEADQQFVNAMNVIEIVESAKKTQSVECIHFAEELLGCKLEDIVSTEVKLSPGTMGSNPTHYEHIAKPTDASVKATNRMIKLMQAKLKSYPESIDGNVKIKVPGGLLAIINMYNPGKDRPIVTSKLPYEKALAVCKAVLRFLYHNTAASMVDHEGTIGAGYHDAKGYLSMRSHASKAFKDLRVVFRQLDKITA